jgi:hypothetical protein
MTYVLRIFGFNVISFERIDAGIEYVSNTGGQFDLAPAEEEDEYYEEDSSFGFRGPR